MDGTKTVRGGRYYLGYDDQVHGGISDTGYSVCVIFSTCRLDVVNVAYAAITWRYCWAISVGRMDAEPGHK
jgi:hypothetical protein